MQSLDSLQRAAAEGLAFLRAQDDLDEAEIFVSSNGQLYNRLHYTSHIPCNGLEEPKSDENFGVGVQAVWKSEEGPRRVGFGSEAGDLSLEAVAQALSKARQGAVPDPEFVSLPRRSAERRTLFDYHDPLVMDIADEALVRSGWNLVGGALRECLSSETLQIAAGNRDLTALGLILGGDVTILQERVAIASSAIPDVQTDESTLVMSFITSMVEAEASKGSGWAVETHLQRLDDGAGRAAAQGAIASMGGIRVPTGEYTVVFGPQAVTDLMNNLIVPAVNLGVFYMMGTPFVGKLGTQVAWEGLTLYDHGAAPGLAGSKGITDEGLPTGRTELISNGVLTGLIANHYESQRILRDEKGGEKLGCDPAENAWRFVPRNGFRFSRGGGRHFTTTPGIFGTNMVIEGSRPLSREDLLASVADGVYVGRIWYTYPVNGLRAGDFTCTVIGDSYRIRDGRLAEPLKPNTIRINDNIERVLNAVTGIASTRRPTLVWAADEVTHAPEIAVTGVPLTEIAGYLETGG